MWARREYWWWLANVCVECEAPHYPSKYVCLKGGRTTGGLRTAGPGACAVSVDRPVGRLVAISPVTGPQPADNYRGEDWGHSRSQNILHFTFYITPDLVIIIPHPHHIYHHQILQYTASSFGKKNQILNYTMLFLQNIWIFVHTCKSVLNIMYY